MATQEAEVLNRSAFQEKGKCVPWHKDNRKELYCIFSMNGFSPRLRELADSRDDLILSE